MKFTNILCTVQSWVWYAISSHGIIGPYFYENAEGHTVIVNIEQHKVMLATLPWSELGPLGLLLFQQLEATAHTADFQATPYLRKMFCSRTFWYIY